MTLMQHPLSSSNSERFYAALLSDRYFIPCSHFFSRACVETCSCYILQNRLEPPQFSAASLFLFHIYTNSSTMSHTTTPRQHFSLHRYLQPTQQNLLLCATKHFSSKSNPTPLSKEQTSTTRWPITA